MFFPVDLENNITNKFYLTRISLPSDVIDLLKTINLFMIGFGELTNCVNNDNCLNNLIHIYKILRKEFNVPLFYYGTMGSPSYVLRKLIDVDYIGYSIYQYIRVDNSFKIHPQLEQYISDLSKTGKLMIGEIGFRLHDNMGWFNAGSSEIVEYKENAHRNHYVRILNLLAQYDAKYIGIWSWNDRAFAIRDDPVVQQLILQK